MSVQRYAEIFPVSSLHLAVAYGGDLTSASSDMVSCPTALRLFRHKTALAA